MVDIYVKHVFIRLAFGDEPNIIIKYKVNPTYIIIWPDFTSL